MHEGSPNRSLTRYLAAGRVASPLLFYSQEPTSFEAEVLLTINHILSREGGLTELAGDRRVMFLQPSLGSEVEGEERSKGRQARLRKGDVEAAINFLTQTTGEVFLERVLVIEGVESADRYAANLLLKHLEALPREAKVILTTHHLEGVLATLRSRCLIFEVTRRGSGGERANLSLAGYTGPLLEVIPLIYDLNQGTKTLLTLLPAERLGQLLAAYKSLPQNLSFLSLLFETLTQENQELLLRLVKLLLISHQDPIKLRRLLALKEGEGVSSLQGVDALAALRVVANFQRHLIELPELDFELQKAGLIGELITIFKGREVGVRS